jgi:tetratricopeptide (TPR) repeat protein
MALPPRPARRYDSADRRRSTMPSAQPDNDPAAAALTLADGEIQAGRYREAVRVLEELHARNPDQPRANYLHGVALAMLGDRSAAHERFVRAAQLDSRDAPLQCYAAASCIEQGQRAAAAHFCRTALDADPQCEPAYQLLASAELPGAHYLQLLARIHAHLRPPAYVEIGIAAGESFRIAQPPTVAIGIDPHPRLDGPVAANHRVFRETSDEFFARYDLVRELGGRPVDLALIDGMHQFEFVLRDFLNLERHCAPDATILVHDCFPLDEVSAARERTTAFWSGDVWRALLALKKWRPDLALHTVGAPPTGLGVIRNLDPASRVLAENLDRICAEFRAVGYETIAGRKSEALNLVPNEWPDVRALFDAPARPVGGPGQNVPG